MKTLSFIKLHLLFALCALLFTVGCEKGELIEPVAEQNGLVDPNSVSVKAAQDELANPLLSSQSMQA